MVILPLLVSTVRPANALRGSLTVMVQMHLLLFTLMEASPLRP